MKKIILILIISFQTSLFAQKEIVGKVEFYKSVNSELIILEPFSDGTIRNLTNREHRIKILQKDRITELITDSTGIFKFSTVLDDILQIKVNETSPVLSGNFRFNYNEIKDTLKLQISDKKLAIYRDSIQAPEFYKKYREEQAYIDFENGIRRVFGAGGMVSNETIKKNKLLEEKYGLKYEYLFGCIVDRTKISIVYRYNQVIKKLIGIEENVW